MSLCQGFFNFDYIFKGNKVIRHDYTMVWSTYDVLKTRKIEYPLDIVCGIFSERGYLYRFCVGG